MTLWATEKLNNMVKVTQLARDGAQRLSLEPYIETTKL